MMMRSAAALVTAVVLALAGIAPAAAGAADDWEGQQGDDHDIDGPNGFRDCALLVTDDARGQFCPDRDEIYIEDLNGDSQRVGFEWKVRTGEDAGRWGLCYGTFGSNQPIGQEYYYAQCNKAIGGGEIIFRIDRCDGTVDPCQEPGEGSGWNGWSAWTEVDNPGLN